SRAALDVLAGLPRIGEDFVLTVAGTGPFRGYAKGKRRLDALLPADMPPWRLHDLRRSVASGLARLGINLPTIERLLNHVSGSFAGIVGVYQKHDFGRQKRGGSGGLGASRARAHPAQATTVQAATAKTQRTTRCRARGSARLFAYRCPLHVR